MLRYHVPLNHMANGGWVCLRQINGEDEYSVRETSTAAAIRLLDRLLTAEPGTTLNPGEACKLPAPERDRLLATVYSQTYGSRIDSTTDCQQCGTPFDLDFSLDNLQATLEQNKNTSDANTESDGTFCLPDGQRFRLPTGEDELAVAGLPPEEAETALLSRCAANGATIKDQKIIQKAMNELAPIMDLELAAICPECNHKQSVRFDIQTYLLTRIQQERKRLVHEVHRIAGAYGWSLQEILGIDRSWRHELATLVENELMERT